PIHKDTVATPAACITRKLSLLLTLADLKLHVLQLLDREMTRQLMQAHWKKRRLHLAGQNRAQTSTRPFITKDPDQIFAVVGRGKERQTLNVIPVRVRNQKGQFDRSR